MNNPDRSVSGHHPLQYPEFPFGLLFGLPIARIPYFQNAYRGAFQMAASIFATRAFCTLVRTRSGRDRLSYKLSWA